MADPYAGREQTKTKHFILKRYLQALAFKVLRYFDITYVDGFSGPWKTQTEGFADSSFRIAIDALRDAQKTILLKLAAVQILNVSFQRTAAKRIQSLRRRFRNFTNHQTGLRLKPTMANSKTRFLKYKPLSVIPSH